MKQLIVRTAQMIKWRTLNDGLDITVKSGDKAFAPTWDMVMGYKNGTKSEEQYEAEYVALMERSMQENRERWFEVLNSGSVTLLCYCRAGDFCHRTLLVDLLDSFSIGHGVEVIYRGEVT
jgi:uncharacterized protein YeaO (DUF488 family)